MADTKPSLTAAELKAIGERVNNYSDLSLQVAPHDRARLYAALVGLLNREFFQDPGEWHTVLGQCRRFATKADAIDAILSQGGGE